MGYESGVVERRGQVGRAGRDAAAVDMNPEGLGFVGSEALDIVGCYGHGSIIVIEEPLGGFAFLVVGYGTYACAVDIHGYFLAFDCGCRESGGGHERCCRDE